MPGALQEDKLDQPGEWFLDRKSGILYFWPPAPIAEGKAVVSIIPALVTATNASVTNGIVFGKAAPATVDVFYDYQCPHCLTLEQGAHSALETAARSGKVQLRFHPVAFLDASSSGNDYSTRAANAALCASDVSVDMFLKYHDILFGTD